jgi:hypothetical protein
MTVAAFVSPSALRLQRALCLLVVAIIVVAAAYALWTGVVNFSRIRV